MILCASRVVVVALLVLPGALLITPEAFLGIRGRPQEKAAPPLFRAMPPLPLHQLTLAFLDGHLLSGGTGFQSPAENGDAPSGVQSSRFLQLINTVVLAAPGAACEFCVSSAVRMKSHLRFHQLTIEICTDDIRRFLRGCPHSSLTQIMEHVCHNYSRLAGSQRLKLWTEVRGVLLRMEEKGLVRCVGGMAGNTWSVLDAEAPGNADDIRRN